MTIQELQTSIIADLGANYISTDSSLLASLISEVVNDALFISNRNLLVKDEATKQVQIEVLASQIRKAVKTLYLQRGAEDVSSQSLAGINSTYEDVQAKLRDDIVKSGKRIIR